MGVLDTRHQPLEGYFIRLYRTYTDYHGMMDLTRRNVQATLQSKFASTTTAHLILRADVDPGKPFENYNG